MAGTRLMITNEGALGDTGFVVPALNVLRERYDKIYMLGKACIKALANTGLVDLFITRPDGYDDWTDVQKRAWLTLDTPDFDVGMNCSGVVPGKYMFHAEDPKFDRPQWWKMENAKGISYYDATSRKLGVPEAIGERPTTPHREDEKDWLAGFRRFHNIPEDAFLLGWQFTGSSVIKWYPHFDEVIQYNIMEKYPNVYVVGMGDLEGKLKWNYLGHRGRFINLADTVTFRQAYILTSIMDLLVGPETGVMVFAQGYPKTPKIVLATHTHGSEWTFPETQIIASEAECSPCFNIVADCEHEEGELWVKCMGAISPERVIGAIEGIINETRMFVQGGRVQRYRAERGQISSRV